MNIANIYVFLILNRNELHASSIAPTTSDVGEKKYRMDRHATGRSDMEGLAYADVCWMEIQNT
jgi:hypothetical protein